MKTTLFPFLLCVAFAGVTSQPRTARAADAPLNIDLTLSPHAAGAADSYMGVSMTLHQPKTKSGEILLRMPLKIVGIPTARYDGDAIAAVDDQGTLPLMAEEEAETPIGINRHWKVARDTVGDVRLSYRAPPRQISAATNNGPLFDLRFESGGFMGAGVSFIAAPTAEGTFHVRLTWDLSGVTPGSRGVWTYGQGPVEVDIPAENLAYSYFAAGPLKSIPTDGNDKFAVYWLTEPPFPAQLLGERLRMLFSGLAKFFHDDGAQYRVFMRQNPYEGKGGTSLGRSFMFGYNPEEKPTVDDLQYLLAHELTHLWPMLEGEHGDTAWYSEGNAEYYSIVESYRLRLLTAGQFLDTINERADAYYSNPFVHLSNPEAAKIFWKDPVAQTVPYGRGFMYLAITDDAIRTHSHGKRSLDDVVVALHLRDTRHQSHGIPEWLDLVGKEIGAAEAKRTYEAMVGGQLQVPRPGVFAPCFNVAQKDVPQFRLGFSRNSLNDDRIVRQLEPDAPAGQAGLREGDKLTDVKGVVDARKDPNKIITLVVARPEGAATISFSPRGALVEGYNWVRSPDFATGAKGSSCEGHW